VICKQRSNAPGIIGTVNCIAEECRVILALVLGGGDYSLFILLSLFF
jgi:hypothetical protein